VLYSKAFRSTRRIVLLLLLVALIALRPWVFAADDNKPTDPKAAPQVAAPKDVGELKALETQVKKVVTKVLPCTVGVQVGAARGSGVIVSADGYVMTAGHVVRKPGEKATFFLPDGKTAKGITLGMFKSADAGLMKISEGGPWPFAEKGRAETLKPGSWAVAVGHPFGFRAERPPVVRIGRILRLRESVIQTDCPLVAGDSGGPLFDLEGKVIGINSRIGGSTSMNYHVPIDVFHENWDRLVKGEAWKTTLPGRDGSNVRAALREVVTAASQCVVRVKCDDKDAALGTIVGPDGWILTKASELEGHITCHFRDGRKLDSSIVGVDPRFDLAMLKVEATDLPAIEWNPGKISVGQWVATPGVADDSLALGVISVPPRRIPPMGGMLGVGVEDGDNGAKVVKVLPDSPAQKAGIKVNDLITHVDGKATPSHMELVATVKKHPPGKTIKLTITRGKEKLEVSATLAVLKTASTRKRDMQNRSGVGLSKRRHDFPSVLQHDTVLRPVDCGSPLVDLDGKVIGVNIARGGRTETYCVPGSILITLMYNLMSGRLTPPQIVAARKAKAAAEKKKAEEEAAAAKAAAEKKKAEEKAATEKAAAEKTAAEKEKAEEKAAAEKAAREKAEQEKKAAEAKKPQQKPPEPEKKPQQPPKPADPEKKPA